MANGFLEFDLDLRWFGVNNPKSYITDHEWWSNRFIRMHNSTYMRNSLECIEQMNSNEIFFLQHATHTGFFMMTVVNHSSAIKVWAFVASTQSGTKRIEWKIKKEKNDAGVAQNCDLFRLHRGDLMGDSRWWEWNRMTRGARNEQVHGASELCSHSHLEFSPSGEYASVKRPALAGNDDTLAAWTERRRELRSSY